MSKQAPQECQNLDSGSWIIQLLSGWHFQQENFLGSMFLQLPMLLPVEHIVQGTQLILCRGYFVGISICDLPGSQFANYWNLWT